MYFRASILCLCVTLGCGKAEPKPFDLPTLAKNLKAQQAEADAFLASLKTNPQPLFDMAVARVRKAIATHEGDDEAKTATVTVAPETLKTFGPEKWKVRGRLRTSKHDTTWEVELQMLFDKLQTTHVSLEVD